MKKKKRNIEYHHYLPLKSVYQYLWHCITTIARYLLLWNAEIHTKTIPEKRALAHRNYPTINLVTYENECKFNTTFTSGWIRGKI